MLPQKLLKQLIEFRKERDWEQFHNPKDLAISLSIEAAELLELFQWRTSDEITTQFEGEKRVRLEDELADVAIYLTYLCHDLGIDLSAAISSKIEKNAQKYPIDKVKGKADKYSDYE